MVLIKEIELALKPESNEVRAPEDEILADSVLELANTDFTQVDEYEDVAPGAIRKHVEADMRVAYPGKPTSRKRIFKDKSRNEVTLNEDILKHGKKNIIKSESIREEDSGSDKTEEDDLIDSEIESAQEFHSEEEDEIQSDEDISYEEDTDNEEDSDNENDLTPDFDGSILGSDSEPVGAGSGVEDEQEEDEEGDSSEGIDLFSQRARDIEADIAKGKSIRNQLTIWENLIECRIKLQPILINSNKLYQKDAFKQFKESLSSEEEKTLMQTYSSLSDLMKGLLELQDNLLNAVPSYTEMKSQKRKARTSSDEVESKKKKVGNDLLKDIDEDFKPFRNVTIQKWNEKTKVSSGKINKNDFSAFDLPTLKQIEEILLDQDRLLKRTRTKRSDYTILGNAEKTDSVEDTESNENIKKRQQGEYDPEIFDDDDFYHKLLRDFIEKKTSDVTDVSKRGKQWLELQKLRSRMKAKVDTRASKGRKIRFTIHNKMVNFMAPIHSYSWTDEAKNELFKSLFR